MLAKSRMWVLHVLERDPSTIPIHFALIFFPLLDPAAVESGLTRANPEANPETGLMPSAPWLPNFPTMVVILTTTAVPVDM